MFKALLVCTLGMTCLTAYAGSNCQHVGGSISTNFLDANTTFGTATGDLAGAVGVSVLSEVINKDGSVSLVNQHHWVTTTGDTLNIESAPATGYPSGTPGLYAAIYPNGTVLAGGTGRFTNATGKIASWGAINFNDGEVVLRYEGTVCFAK